MQELEGGLAAVVIQDFAKEIKESAELELDSRIREAACRALRIDADSVPNRLVTSLSRGAVSSASRDRARDSIAMALGKSLNSSDMDITLSESFDADHIIAQILDETEMERRDTHALRTQASFIRGVCRPLYTSWIDEIESSDESGLLPRDYLERKQHEMINFPINSESDLRDWLGEMFDRFANLADVKKVTARSQGRINTSAVRTYRNAWMTFTSRNFSDIWQEMQRRADGQITPKDIRDERFHRPREVPKNLIRMMRSMPDKEMLSADLPPKSSAVKTSAVTATLEEKGASQLKLTKSWTSAIVARQEMRAWLDEAKVILGHDRIDLARLEVDGKSGHDQFLLEESSLSNISELFLRYLNAKANS
jgi:hypothetical protein